MGAADRAITRGTLARVLVDLLFQRHVVSGLIMGAEK
jgi:hypothetical protein